MAWQCRLFVAALVLSLVGCVAQDSVAHSAPASLHQLLWYRATVAGAWLPRRAPKAANNSDANTTLTLCRKWGLEPAPDAEPPRVFDFFIANNELDMMEIRLEELHTEVDHFFVLEARETFRGKPKPLSFPRVMPRLSGQTIRKVHYTVLDTLEGDTAWSREVYQRNQMVSASLGSSGFKLNRQDVIITSDLDEIPKPEFVRVMKHCKVQYPIALDSHMHYYSFNFVNGDVWRMGPTAVQAWQMESVTGNELRHFNNIGGSVAGAPFTHYSNAAWHCSFCFSHASAFQWKLSSFSHEEFDTPQSNNLDNLLKSLTEGWVLFSNDVGKSGVQPHFKRLPEDQVDIPAYLRHGSNPKRFAYLLNRTGEFAGLVDVAIINSTVHKIVHQHHAHNGHARHVDSD